MLSNCFFDWFHPIRLLHVRNGNCKYHLGEETFKLAQSYMDKLAKHGHQANKAALYGELCALLFAKSHYDEVHLLAGCRAFSPWTHVDDCAVLVSQAYRWCIEAMKEITPGLPVKVVVDVLRQASKVQFKGVTLEKLNPAADGSEKILRLIVEIFKL